MFTVMKFRKLKKFVDGLREEDRVALTSYLVSDAVPETVLGESRVLADRIERLAGLPSTAWAGVLFDAVHWKNNQGSSNLDEAPPVGNGEEKQFVFKMNAASNIDPAFLLVVARDVEQDVNNLSLQVLSLDRGDYVPVPPTDVANLLRGYADVIENQQEALNQWDKH